MVNIMLPNILTYLVGTNPPPPKSAHVVSKYVICRRAGFLEIQNQHLPFQHNAGDCAASGRGAWRLGRVGRMGWLGGEGRWQWGRLGAWAARTAVARRAGGAEGPAPPQRGLEPAAARDHALHPQPDTTPHQVT